MNNRNKINWLGIIVILFLLCETCLLITIRLALFNHSWTVKFIDFQHYIRVDFFYTFWGTGFFLLAFASGLLRYKYIKTILALIALDLILWGWSVWSLLNR